MDNKKNITMKKLNKILASLGVFMLLLVAASCSENEVEPLFDQSINERTEALTAEYLDVLTAPENGWIGYYSPNENFGAYTMLIDFETNGDVTVDSDYEAGAYNNSLTYRLTKSLKIELVFESTSAFSQIFSLNNNNNSGEFVFNILSATEDEVVLESKLDYGDDVTILTLNRANVEDLDLTPIYASVLNIGGDGTQSVFRNILLNDEIIGTFEFNTTTRLTTVRYIDDATGEVVSISVPIVITSTGFTFITPLDINGTLLTSFTFDELELEYVNTEDGLRIVYGDIPGLPLDNYMFGVDHGTAVFNLDETYKNSTAFNNFYAEFSEDIANSTVLPGLEITNIIIWELNTGGVPYIDVRTNYGNVWYDISFDFVEDTGVVKFEFTGATNSPDFFTEILQPLLDVMFNSTKGYYTVNSGNYLFYPNVTFGLINADNPAYKFDFWTF